MLLSALALALGVPAQVEAAPDPPLAAHEDLAAAKLLQNRSAEAIAILENSRRADPDDAAVLINLGIAYAHAGREAEARALFDAALSKRTVHDLAIAEGDVTNSRQLARRAIRMLERGEFRPAAQTGGQLTLRD